ncbi:MAG: cytidylate kinase-like family protein [Magnetococcales bacterium]|nr:cytidylate kinase-like family protein [Magnetococcales bacterium]
MENNVRAVNAFVESIRFNLENSNDVAAPKNKVPLATVSREFGANGSKTAEQLAKRMGVKCYGYTLLNSIVDTLKSNRHLTQLFDEKFADSTNSWFLSLFSGGKGSKDEYLRCLFKAVTVIARNGGVIIGRGAHLILANDPSVFRVKIEGSMDRCAKRIAEREGIDAEAAKARIYKTESERKEYVREIYKLMPTDRSYYDLVINSDHLKSAQMVDIIVFAMEQRGLPISMTPTT